MSDSSRKLTAVVLSFQALLALIVFSGAPPSLSPSIAVTKRVGASQRQGTTKRVRTTPRRYATKKRRSSIRISASAEAARVIRLALRITHEPRSWIHSLEWLAFRESTNNPRATAYEGVGNETAYGLFQVLPTTFAAHALPGMKNIWNPVDNTTAAIRYIAGRYGTPKAIPGLESTSYVGY